MGFLEQQDPRLFERFQRVKAFDRRVAESFADLEDIAQELERDGKASTAHVAGILAELTEELRRRVALCEQRRSEIKEMSSDDD